MLYKDKQLPELYTIKHLHDDSYVDNESRILDRSLSPYLFRNDTMNAFLKLLQRPIHLFFDKFNIIRNFKNPTVDKYEYRHPD